MTAGQTGIDLITLDHEKVTRVLMKHNVHPEVIDIIAELHDTTRAMQKVFNEMMAEHGKMIEALSLVNKGFGAYATRLQNIEKKYGDANLDLVTHESKLDG